MKLEHPLAFADLPGYSPHLRRLLAMMTYARDTTLHAARGLNVAQLDYLVHPEGNTVGMLLAHVAAVEDGYFHDTVTGEAFDWEVPACALGAAGRAALRGRPLEHYVGELERVRARTEARFLTLDDAWLHTTDASWGTPTNNYFRWFHVLEDEINHRGQIRLLRKLLPDDL